jgi:hypothetical protein
VLLVHPADDGIDRVIFVAPFDAGRHHVVDAGLLRFQTLRDGTVLFSFVPPLRSCNTNTRASVSQITESKAGAVL